MKNLRYVLMIISVLLAMSILLVGCQIRSQQPAALKELNVSIIATQMKVTEPAAPPTPAPPTPAPAPPPGATQAKTGAPQAGSPPAGPPPGPPTISITITFKIDNPNDVDVKLQQFTYSVSGSGISIPVKMGQLLIIDSKIPAKGSIIREDTIDITRAGPYAAMWDLIKQADKWSVNGVALVVQEGFSFPFAATK